MVKEVAAARGTVATITTVMTTMVTTATITTATITTTTRVAGIVTMVITATTATTTATTMVTTATTTMVTTATIITATTATIMATTMVTTVMTITMVVIITAPPVTEPAYHPRHAHPGSGLALRRVFVRPPHPEDAAAWDRFGWHAAPDPAAADAEHEALREILHAAGAEVVRGASRTAGDPDAIYAYDPVLMTDAGAIYLRPGKVGRRAETEGVTADLEAAGVPEAGRLREPATAEGGDMFWLDAATLLVGRGYRTNDAGIAQLRALLDSSRRRGHGVRPSVPERPRGVPASDVVHLPARPRPRGRVPPA